MSEANNDTMAGAKKSEKKNVRSARTKDGEREKELKSEFQILEIHERVETDRIQQLLIVDSQRDRKPRAEAVRRHGGRVLAPGTPRRQTSNQRRTAETEKVDG